MPDAAARRGRLGELYELLAGTDSITEFLADLSRVASDEIDRELSCGLTVRTEDGPITVASSDALAAELDEVQYEAGTGPCLQAMTTGEPVEVDDPATAPWEAWRAAATSRRLEKTLSMPLTVTTGQTLGALNLYSVSVGEFGAADREAAAVFAAQAAGALLVALRLTEQAELLGHLQAALTSRSVIDQAKGILMGQQRCSADEAFDLLRRASQHRNVRLRDIAAAVVDRYSSA